MPEWSSQYDGMPEEPAKKPKPKPKIKKPEWITYVGWKDAAKQIKKILKKVLSRRKKYIPNKNKTP